MLGRQQRISLELESKAGINVECMLSLKGGATIMHCPIIASRKVGLELLYPSIAVIHTVARVRRI